MGDKKKVKRPTKITALGRIGIIQFCIGGNHCAGITGKRNNPPNFTVNFSHLKKASGNIYVWGSGENGCLGRGDHATLVKSFIKIQIF